MNLSIDNLINKKSFGSNQMIIYMGFAIIVVLVLFIILSIQAKKSKNTLTVSKSRGSMRGLYLLYRFFSKTPILKRYYTKIRMNLEINYPADEISIRRKATLNMMICSLGALSAMLAVIFMAKGDYFFIMMGCFLTFFIFSYMISTIQRKMDDKLISQLADFITNIRHYYSSTGNVEDAIYETINETPYEMGLHADRIYKILSSANVESEVDKYTDIAPNKFMLTLVAICATIKEFGDKTLEDGQSLFLTNVNYLKEEINVEMIRRKRNNFMFSGLVALTLLPLLFLKAIQAWGTSNIPEMSSFYSGSAGTIVMFVIFAVTVLCYQLICNLKDGQIEDTRDYKIIFKLLEIPIINKLATNEINRNYTKHLRIDDGLKMVGNHIGIKGFLIKRVIYGIIAVLILNLVIFTSEWRTRKNILNNFEQAFETSMIPSNEVREQMRAAAQALATSNKRIKDTPRNREKLLDKLVKSGLLDKNAKLVVEEVMQRCAQYQDVYYRWWFVFINVLAFLLGYSIPYVILQYQLKIVKMNMEDEVVQFQTIVLILMHVDGIMLDTVLEWMERFAFCFKQSISECIINLEYSTQQALLHMRNSEIFPPFRRFTDNLLMVDEEDILTAFSEIEIDREYYKQKRETDNNIITTKKSEIGKLIAFGPLIITLVGYLIGPFAVYAIRIMSSIGM